MEGRNPVEGNSLDNRVLMLIRRATLDSFWSSEPTTVRGNLRQGGKMEDIAAQLGLSPVMGAMGPFPLSDTTGMKLAVVMLERWLDPGKNERLVQYSTVHTLRSAYSNIIHASIAHASGVSMFTGASKKMITTTCPSNGFWFDQFMVGYYKQVGQLLLVQHLAILIEVVLAVQNYLEGQWGLAQTDREQRSVAQWVFFLLFAFA